MNLCNAVVHNAPEDIMVVGSKRDHQSDRIVFYRLGWEKKWKGWTIFYFKRPLLTSPIQSSWSGISLRSVVCITIHNLMSSTLDFKQLDRPPSLPQTPPLTSELVLLETTKTVICSYPYITNTTDFLTFPFFVCLVLTKDSLVSRFVGCLCMLCRRTLLLSGEHITFHVKASGITNSSKHCTQN